MVYRPQPYSPSPAPREGRERRLAVRYPAGRKSSANAMVVLGDTSQSAKVHDVSACGIGLVLGRALDAGTVVTAHLYNAPHLFHCSRLLRVAHAEPQEDGSYLIGCEFSTPLAYDQLQALIW